jgi:hypothetical protein
LISLPSPRHRFLYLSILISFSRPFAHPMSHPKCNCYIYERERKISNNNNFDVDSVSITIDWYTHEYIDYEFHSLDLFFFSRIFIIILKILLLNYAIHGSIWFCDLCE